MSLRLVGNFNKTYALSSSVGNPFPEASSNIYTNPYLFNLVGLGFVNNLLLKITDLYVRFIVVIKSKEHNSNGLVKTNHPLFLFSS